ncbi:MAG TPA: hypothetical protein PKA28_10815 [Methylomusa anaerophila]|uniref:Uncharacterized protein n=1 Tax=Methylomusa anaerophila TaxID=1930071 RepID=A0A348AJ04_9FIRM|nr:hypothetical protein [Methylomusa anaerophila]BBB91052.1 hypothetical protein MAMMFC1_01720 [Methylomusa anaerophila]HML88926.1 hypothetical protein [Methylomusa anaerophila]
MTPLILMDELCGFLRETVKDFRLSAKKYETAPVVYDGYLPLEDEPEQVCPYVIARITKVSDADKGSTTKIAILIGTRAEDDGFWRDCVNVAERIRQALLVNRVLAKRFRLQLPLEIIFPEGQMPYPEAVCALETIWTIPQPQPRLEENVYGENIPGWK